MSSPLPPPLALVAAPPWPSAPAAPSWMRWSAAALIAYPLFLLTLPGFAIDDPALDSLGSIVRLCIEASAFLWAAARVDLPRRLVLALRISGWTSLAAALNYAVLVPAQLGGPELISPSADAALTLAGYLGVLAALLVYPRAAARPGERAALIIDAVVTTGGFGLLGWTLVTQTSASIANDATTEFSIRAFGLAQLAVIGGLNVVVVRGLAVPSPRAFWWFITGQALYLPVIFLAQLYRAGVTPSWPLDAVYYLAVLPTLVASHAFRTDPMVHAGRSGGPSWLRDLNPIPLSMPLFVGGALLVTLSVGPADRALPLALTLMAISLLLAARLLLSARHTAQRARAEAAREQRRQSDRLKAVGRLAGGIAHEFNNLMARVIGNTELGEASLPPHVPAREHFVRARTAALRAAELTSQLLAFSGQQKTQLERLDMDAAVTACYGRAARDWSPGIAADLQRGEGPYTVFADTAQFGVALLEVLDNAIEAMPTGGRLSVRVGREQVRDGLRLAQLAVPPGTYVVVAVSDTGVGMTADAVAVACDPFYSTKPSHLGAGLGLASVHGFIASHSGGLAIESSPGLGTTVRLYLPVA